MPALYILCQGLRSPVSEAVRGPDSSFLPVSGPVGGPLEASPYYDGRQTCPARNFCQEELIRRGPDSRVRLEPLSPLGLPLNPGASLLDSASQPCMDDGDGGDKLD